MDRLAINHLSPVSIPITSFPTPISTPKPIFPAAANSLHLRIPATGEKIVTDPLQKPSRLMAPDSSEETPAAIRLNPIEATAESFQEFGQVVEASLDGDEFGPGDAQLDLSRGVPRLYIMHLEDRPLKFSTITHHANVTQCLGSIGGHVWYLGVAKPSIVDPSEIKGVIGPEIIRSHCGHYYVPPAVDEVRVFKISGPKFLKLNAGTWHAGPLFLDKTMDFYNLELSNTNVVDHTTHDYHAKTNKIVFFFDP